MLGSFVLITLLALPVIVLAGSRMITGNEAMERLRFKSTQNLLCIYNNYDRLTHVLMTNNDRGNFFCKDVN